MQLSVFLGLTSIEVRCKLPVGIEVLLYGLRLPSSLHRLFQQKARENPPSFKNAFANRYEIPARDHSVYVSCLLDVSLRPISRFLAGPSRTRMGSVRLFLCSDVTSCVIVIPSEATMLLSVRPTKHHLRNSAGNQIVRRVPRIFQSFSRNGTESFYSGISVFMGQ